MSVASDTLRGFVRSRAGISLGSDKDYLVTSRLEPHLKEWGMTSLEGLARYLGGNPRGPVAHQVVEALTINETSWFRDGRPFDLIRTAVLPDLLSGTPARNLAIWSAACSSGQEVYSIAMTIRESVGAGGNHAWSILGSDISEPILARARAGVYSDFEMQRGLSEQRRARYFETLGRDHVVRKELRRGVTFRQMNLIDLPNDLGPFDLVLCRNVLIYFDVDVKERVLSAIARRMRPGAYLILGTAESILGISDRFVSVPNVSGLYRVAR